MYLKRLEMTGFKSFASRTELEFVPGITAVVGPNGSGKSNVTDGIRWVLGEQSAKSLRGAKMEDVIFAGSDSRKPVGYCEVTMTFDNTERRLPTDYTEVSISRRVYRSGDSEYYLNKQACRLKDIQELFMDTGIGKDAYSMIGQGKIDEILSSKSEDRRIIFEEAAGIVKYKTRKKEAERKLEGTEQNLSRIHDLIHELDKQVEPLAEQSSKATRFKQLKAELQQVEVGLYVHKIENLHDQWQHSTQDVKELTEEQVSLGAKVSRKEAELEHIKFQLSKHEETWEEIQAHLLTASEELEKAEGQREVRQERLRNRDVTHQQLQERLQQLEQELTRLRGEEQNLQERLTAKRAEWEQVEADLQAISEKLTLDPVDETEQLAELQQRLQAEVNQWIALSSEQQYVMEQLEQMTERMTTLNQELTVYTTKQEEHTERLLTIQSEQQKLESERATLSTHQRQLEEERLQLEQTEEKKTQQVRQAEQELHRLHSQVEMMKEMESDHQGFFQGVKEVLQARDRGEASLQGVHGAVAQLIQVPAEYEVAMETALGSSLQHLVVENEQTGRNGIYYLKEKQLGRATFLPLDVVQDKSLSFLDLTKVKRSPGWVGVAAELVQTDKRYNKLVQHLLGLVVVAEKLEHANQIANQLQYRYRVVTLDGDVVNAGGSMSGGSRAKSKSNLLGRSRQLEELEAQKAEATAKYQTLTAEWQQFTQEKKRWTSEWEEARALAETHRQREQVLKAEEREARFQAQNTEERRQQVLQQQQQAQVGQDGLQQRFRGLVEQIQEAEQRKQQLQGQIEQTERRVKLQSATKEELSEQMTEWKITSARLQQETTHFTENITRFQQEQQRIAEQKEATLVDLQSLEEQKETHDSEMDQWEQKIVSLRQEKDDVQLQMAETRQTRERMIRERDAKEQEVRSTQQVMNKQRSLLHDLEVRVNRLDVELNHLLQKLAEEYETSFEGAKQTYTKPEDPVQAERQVRQLKNQIVTLGEVNLGAIEEYERLTDRLHFLQTQEADLLGAKQTLYQIIGQMEEEMGKRFLENFELIRTEFQEVFVKMFGGGHADLYLSDPTQLLETGIEIVAQPPGKKLQNLTLLSGGERALAAIALLFAVLGVKPVPFCVLDEVDAALDEANLTRFTRYMRQFANKTQFIIITHRKHTMEGADVLYGITMQESGVSKLVSVKLEEYDGQREVAAAVE